MYTVRPMHKNEFDSVYNLVEQDFPPIEYPPRALMRRHIAGGFVRGHVLSAKDGQRAGYALMLVSPACPANMLFLYATARAMRSRGLGSAFLRELLAEYAHMDGMYAEVEKAELGKTSEDRRLRERRIAFYERLGFVRLPHLRHVIYGVDMHLYYRPIQNGALPEPARTVQWVRALYGGILPPPQRFWLRIREI